MTPRAIVLSDIFGLCAGLKCLLADLNQAGVDVQLVDPYQGQTQQFADETQAYTAYSTQCGHDAYAAIAQQALQNAVRPFELAIGFSAGATALWRALADTRRQQIKQAILFYPGQIHQHLMLTPQAPTQVIFGHSEPHFVVGDMCRQLQQQGVIAISTPYAHGFMNQASKAFDEDGYQQQLVRLKLMMRDL